MDDVFKVRIKQEVPSGYTFRSVCQLADDHIADFIELHNFKYKHVFVLFKIGGIQVSKHFKSEYRRDGAMAYGSFMCFDEFSIINEHMFGVYEFEITLTEEKLNK